MVFGLLFRRRFQSFANPLQSRHPTSEFVQKFVTVPAAKLLIIAGIRGVRFRLKLRNFLLQPSSLFLHAIVAHGLVPRRVGLHFGSIKSNSAKLHKPRCGTHLQRLIS